MFRLILRTEEKNQEIKGNSMRKKICCIFLLVAFLLMVCSNGVNATTYDDYDSYSNDNYYRRGYYDDEREDIVDYDIEIHVNEDASMDVKETITVNAMGDQIKHGIYRDFPTQYKNKLVTFEINEVTMDGGFVNYTTESVDRGVRIRIGSEDDVVSNGRHTYTIDYTTERQLFFEEDYNELYWNLIGSGWSFCIERCSAKIYFPKKTEILEDDIKTFVGEYGDDKESDDVYYYVDSANSAVYFNMYSEIPASNAFTVVVRVEKGTIDEPTFEQKFEWFVQDNIMYIIIFAGMICLGVWQLYTWKKYGKDPEKRVVIPRYYPPEGMDPGDVRYMDTMGDCSRVLEATMISLATKGFLKFTKASEKSKSIVVEKVKDKNIDEFADQLSENEMMVYKSLGDSEILKYSQSLYTKITSMNSKISKNLDAKYKDKLFFKNWGKIVFSIFATVFIFAGGTIAGLFINPFASLINFQNAMMVLVTAGILTMVFVVCKSLFKNKDTMLFNVIFAVLWGGPFLLFGLIMAVDVIQIYVEYIFQGFVLVGMVVQNYLYMKLIPRYTEEGLRLKEEIAGFELFVITTKDDDFAEKTPEMFDKYFAYAYVLGLENSWASKFESVLKEANYTPSWCSDYMFVNGMFDCSSFTSSFSSSFSSGVSAASTSPASSSSSGGGGFSGGGGGGRWPEVAGKIYLRGSI